MRKTAQEDAENKAITVARRKVKRGKVSSSKLNRSRSIESKGKMNEGFMEH